MNIVFFGTPHYVLPVLKKVHKKYLSRSGSSPIIAVVTQKPKPAGRQQLLKYSAIDDWAHERKIPIHFDPMEIVRNYPNANIGILASYGQIIPKAVIDHFEHGILNVHPSLLPYWRGASPVQASIIDGGPVGSTIMQLDEKLDHGPIVDEFVDKLLDDDTTETLRDRLFVRSADVLASLIPAYVDKKINLEEQVHEKATFTTQVKRDDAYIDPEQLREALTPSKPLQGATFKGRWLIPFMKDFTTSYTPATIHNFIRAMQPWPQAWTTVKLNKSDKETKRLKLLRSHLEPIRDSSLAAQINEQDTTKVEAQPIRNDSRNKGEDSILILDEVQLEGKTPVSWQQFLDGYPNASLS